MDIVVDGASCGGDRNRTGHATEAPISHTVFGVVEGINGKVLLLDVLPDIAFGPVEYASMVTVSSKTPLSSRLSSTWAF